MKKGIISMLCIALAVGTLTGCGSKKEDNRLVIWTNMNVEVDTLQKYADTWGEQNGYEVEVIHQSPSVQQFAQAVKSAEGPDAVVGIPNDQLADYVNAGLTAEVPAELYNDADFSEAAVQACYVDGKRYAAPLSVETTALFYNTDMVEKVPACSLMPPVSIMIWDLSEPAAAIFLIIRMVLMIRRTLAWQMMGQYRRIISLMICATVMA